MQPLGREVFEDAVNIAYRDRSSFSVNGADHTAQHEYIATSARASQPLSSTLHAVKYTLHRWYSVKVDRADVVVVVSSFPVLSSRGVCTLGTGTAVRSVKLTLAKSLNRSLKVR